MTSLMWILFCQRSVCQRHKYSESVTSQKMNTIWEAECPIYSISHIV